MCFHERCSRSQVGPSSRQSCTEHIYSEMQYRKRSAKLGKVRFPCAYINFLKELIVVFVHEPVYSLQVLQTVLQFITRVTLYDGVGSGVQLNVKLWTLWLCWASWILICGLFSTHQITENTVVLKLIASKKTFEVTNSFYKPQKALHCYWGKNGYFVWFCICITTSNISFKWDFKLRTFKDDWTCLVHLYTQGWSFF